MGGLFLCFVVLGASCAPPAERTPDLPAVTEGASPSPTCQFPRFGPTYLPWLGEAERESIGAIPADPAVPTLPDGAEGRLYEGSDGSWGVVWVDPFPSPYEDPCSETTLSLDMPNVSSARQREELLQVPRSLERG